MGRENTGKLTITLRTKYRSSSRREQVTTSSRNSVLTRSRGRNVGFPFGIVRRPSCEHLRLTNCICCHCKGKPSSIDLSRIQTILSLKLRLGRKPNRGFFPREVHDRGDFVFVPEGRKEIICILPINYNTVYFVYDFRTSVIRYFTNRSFMDNVNNSS